jgi:hypothetical protein
MMNWLKRYYTRRDTRLGFWKEDMKITLVCYGITLGACYGYNKYLDWKDRKETENRIKEAWENNDELQAYMNEED